MKNNAQFAGRAVVFVLLVCVLSLSSSLRAATTELKPALASLSYFNGEWDCSGKFDSSGKTIEAHQSFAPELDGAWMTFRHDDKPPFGYHSLAEWGWDTDNKKFVMIVEDSGGGARLFYSEGWNGSQLQWDGDAMGNSSTPKQRFSFERLDERHFKVSYFTLKNNAWSRVDASTCSKQ
jgi:hypothetical protein